MGRFDGKAVIVTGAGLGIGYALCRRFAREGAHVELNDCAPERAEAASTQLNDEVGAERVEPWPADVADVASVSSLVEEFARRRGRLDVMIANAGLTRHVPLLDETPEGVDRLSAVNLRGTYFSVQAAARAMIAGKREGRILVVSSVAGLRGTGSMTAYGMTKAGIAMLPRLAAVELGRQGITINAITPGAIVTERTLQDDPEFSSHWAGVTPTGRCGGVEDVVEAALFLASPEASHLTGQNLLVDGGWTGVGDVPPGQP